MIESWAEFENGCVPLQLRRAGGTLMSARTATFQLFMIICLEV